MTGIQRRAFMLATLAGAAVARTGAWADDDPWPDLQAALFPGKTLASGDAFIHMTAPERAFDAAVVPIAIDFDAAQMSGIVVNSMTLVVDKNPAPVAAVFHFPNGAANPSIGTRIRVNEYTNVHAVVEAADGRMFASAVFIKAAGGCSAPASKTQVAEAEHLGDMKLKVPQQAALGAPVRLELLIRHPNFTGMQMDQVTRYYVPADFVQTVEITHDGEAVLNVEGNISLSENPAIDFWMTPKKPAALRAKITDSNGRQFENVWLVPAQS